LRRDEVGAACGRLCGRVSTGRSRVRRATIIMASSSGPCCRRSPGWRSADEDTVREVIHLFDQNGLAALDPRWAAGRPRGRPKPKPRPRDQPSRRPWTALELDHAVVHGEDHAADRGELLQACRVGGGGAALGRGERGAQLVRRVPFQLSDQVVRRAADGRGVTADRVPAQPRQPAPERNVDLAVVPVERLRPAGVSCRARK
jgi:hypothetical protein